MERLDLIAPGLADEIRSLTDEARSRLVAEVVRLVVSESGLRDERVDVALRMFPRMDAELRFDDLDALVDNLDRAAWDAQEAGDQKNYLLLFSRARAVSALARAVIGDEADAIYEAAHALREPAQILSLVKQHS